MVSGKHLQPRLFRTLCLRRPGQPLCDTRTHNTHLRCTLPHQELGADLICVEGVVVLALVQVHLVQNLVLDDGELVLQVLQVVAVRLVHSLCRVPFLTPKAGINTNNIIITINTTIIATAIFVASRQAIFLSCLVCVCA